MLLFSLGMSDTTPRDTSPDVAEEKQLTFHYVKSNSFRVIHADGAVVSVGPNRVFFSLYSERLPIPQEQTFALDGDGLGAERLERRVERKGVVREVEVGVSIAIPEAESLVKVMQDQIAKLKAAMASK